MNPMVVLAAWSVLSVPAALAVGALLHAAERRQVRPTPVPVRVNPGR